MFRSNKDDSFDVAVREEEKENKFSWEPILSSFYLRDLLSNFNLEHLTSEEIGILRIWTAPLRTELKEKNAFSIRAREILGVTVI